MLNKSNPVKIISITMFTLLYFFVSIISMIHVVEFFKLSNETYMSWMLSISFELGAACSLLSIIFLRDLNKTVVWGLFLLLTAFQAMGNSYYSFANLHDFQSWIQLFGLVDEDILFQKRILSIISGAILPIIALGYIHVTTKILDKKENTPLIDDEDEIVEQPLKKNIPLTPDEEKEIEEYTKSYMEHMNNRYGDKNNIIPDNPIVSFEDNINETLPQEIPTITDPVELQEEKFDKIVHKNGLIPVNEVGGKGNEEMVIHPEEVKEEIPEDEIMPEEIEDNFPSIDEENEYYMTLNNQISEQMKNELPVENNQVPEDKEIITKVVESVDDLVEESLDALKNKSTEKKKILLYKDQKKEIYNGDID
jgi:hypothetical protein